MDLDSPLTRVERRAEVHMPLVDDDLSRSLALVGVDSLGKIIFFVCESGGGKYDGKECQARGDDAAARATTSGQVQRFSLVEVRQSRSEFALKRITST